MERRCGPAAGRSLWQRLGRERQELGDRQVRAGLVVMMVAVVVVMVMMVFGLVMMVAVVLVWVMMVFGLVIIMVAVVVVWVMMVFGVVSVGVRMVLMTGMVVVVMAVVVGMNHLKFSLALSVSQTNLVYSRASFVVFMSLTFEYGPYLSLEVKNIKNIRKIEKMYFLINIFAHFFKSRALLCLFMKVSGCPHPRPLLLAVARMTFMTHSYSKLLKIVQNILNLK